MDNLTQLIKQKIKEKYPSTKKFADEIGVPMTTVVSALKNGVYNTSYITVSKMCKALDIRILNGIHPFVESDAIRNVFEKLTSLDEKGIHTVTTVLEMEYLRCIAEAENIATAESFAKQNITYQQLNQAEKPTKPELADILKALDDNEDAIR